jgi:hypothetical protein
VVSVWTLQKSWVSNPQIGRIGSLDMNAASGLLINSGENESWVQTRVTAGLLDGGFENNVLSLGVGSESKPSASASGGYLVDRPAEKASACHVRLEASRTFHIVSKSAQSLTAGQPSVTDPSPR